MAGTASCLYPENAVLEGLVLSEETIYTTVGSAVTVSCTPSPYYAAVEGLVWTVEDETVATVKNGTVTAVAAGETTLTATCGNISVSAKIIVNAYAGDITFFDMGNSGAWITSNVGAPGEASVVETAVASNYGFTAGTYANGYVYAADYDNLFFRLNPETLAGEKLGSVGALTIAMAFNYADGYMYAIQQAGSFWEVYYHLVRVNLATGETALVSVLDEYTIGSPIGGLAVDYDGTFRMICMQTDYDTYEAKAVMQSFTVADGEEGCELTYGEPVTLEGCSS